MENIEKEIVEKFAKEIIETCFDVPFSFYDFYKNNHTKVTEDRFFNMKYYKQLMPNDLEVYSIVHQSIMTSVVSGLMGFLDNSEEFRVIHTDLESGKQTDVVALTVGRGEVFGKDGWIMKYSKYLHMLSKGLYDPK